MKPVPSDFFLSSAGSEPCGEPPAPCAAGPAGPSLGTSSGSQYGRLAFLVSSDPHSLKPCGASADSEGLISPPDAPKIPAGHSVSQYNTTGEEVIKESA